MIAKHQTPTKPAAAVASRNYTHPLEGWLRRDWVRLLLRRFSAERPGRARPHLLRALETYGDKDACLHERVAYWPIHRLLDRLRGSLTAEQLHQKLGGHPPTVRGILATARSVARYGLTVPQRWQFPLFVVWNFTHRCNLRCRHCYQNSGSQTPPGELTLAEKLRLVDQLDRQYVAMVAFAGGEPLLCGDLEPVLARCRRYGMHTTIATNGIGLSAKRCRKLADLGVRYIEVSLDSIDPERHDRFRGAGGAWKRAVEGIRNVVATDGLRAGIAMCVTRENVAELEPMMQFATELGVSCFAHFNFIPVGRGVELIDQDLTPEQREQVLQTLMTWMNERQIGVISTAPQFGRLCLSLGDDDGLISCSHAGNASGTKARVVAKYLGGCGAGRTYLCLQPNGDVTPCVYMPDRIMGNIRNRPIREIFQDNPWWDLFCDRDARQGGCGECEYRHYCGGCRARADAYLNRMDHSDPGCLRNRDAWEKLRASNKTDAIDPTRAVLPRGRKLC